MQKFLPCLLLFVSTCRLVCAQTPPVSNGAQDARAKARRLRLWDERYWRLLLHYEKGFSGIRSEVQNSDFFLSSAGRTNPQAELEADLEGFFAAPSEDNNDHPQCRFPARYAWLKSRLGLDSNYLTDVDCPHFQVWREDLNAHSVTLIFASAYLNNPSSMYGHTFLRLDQESHNEQERLLDHAVNFAAITNTKNGVLFAVDGLIGVFPGRFAAMPYYLKVQEYNNLESRDLWEYSLSLDTEEVHRMVLHLWELGHADFPYYFFNKNCSYQLLPLFEVARPSLHMTDHWPLYVIPTDTLRAVIASGLVSGETYRPSQVTRMLYERDQLSPEESHIAGSLARSGDGWDALKTMAPERQALVLDSALDYLQYRVDYRRDVSSETQSLNHSLLTERSRIDVVSPPLDIPAPAPPESGHDTGRLSLGYGYEHTPFMEASWRPALHDLLDRSEGYVPGSDLEMLNTVVGYDLGNHRAYLRDLDLVKIMSLAPADPWILKPSWQIDAGWKTADDLNSIPGKTGYAGMTLGSGLAVKTQVLGRELSYALLDVDGGAGGIFHEDYRLGGGPEIGTVLTPVPWWRTQIEGEYLAYALGDRRSQARIKAENAIDISKDVAIRLLFQAFGQSREYFIGLQRYF